MIRSFRCKETEKIFNRRYSRKLPHEIQDVAFRKLRMVHRSISLDDLRIPPANRLEALRGDRKGSWRIRVNDQYRVCFVWKDGHAFDVEIVDYH
jgi:proteic killer suppression protein